MDSALSLSLSLPKPVTGSPSEGASSGLSLAELGVIFHRQATALLRFASVRLRGDREAALDLLQQLWIALQRSAVRVPPDQVERWLRGVLAKLIATHYRRQGAANRAFAPCHHPALAKQADQALTDEDGAAKIARHAELREQLLLAMTDLPADDQDLLVACYVEGRTHAQIAVATGLSARAVEGRLYRARAALRGRLNRGADPLDGEPA